MMNWVNNIENKLEHISDKILLTCKWPDHIRWHDCTLAGIVIGNCQDMERTDVQFFFWCISNQIGQHLK